MEEDVLTIDDLPKEISNRYYSEVVYKSDGLINVGPSGELATMEDYEKEIIKYAMRKYGSFNKAGKQLGLTHKTIAAKARKFELV
jgi:transcriptional regulator with PAS, ATPase and Fis domain